jgi:hypothetical protein
MSRLGMKNVIARAIVDQQFRQQAFGNGADLLAVVSAAGYDVSEEELGLLSCNTVESFDERFVTIDNMMDFWRLSEERINSKLSGRRAEAGPLPQPGTPAALAEGF